MQCIGENLAQRKKKQQDNGEVYMVRSFLISTLHVKIMELLIQAG
jgi:hypothetical protein